MTEWSLKELLEGLHDNIQQSLELTKRAISHPVSKGDTSEEIWIDMFNDYLPKRYKADKAHIVDSKGKFSDQIDVVIYDRQYTPFIFRLKEQIIIPAESVYAVFEAKQVINAKHIKYAQEKVASVRRLHRTSLPIHHAGGIYPPKNLIPVYGGILTLESDWKPTFGKSINKAVSNDNKEEQLDFGCIANHGYFYWDEQDNKYHFVSGEKPATAFLFKLISQLQSSATVPMIDIQAYAKWLEN